MSANTEIHLHNVVDIAKMPDYFRLLCKKEPVTGRHIINVGELALQFALKLKLVDSVVIATAHGALLHDVGKLFIPIELLTKKGQLSQSERQTMNCHPRFGFEMIKNGDQYERIGSMTAWIWDNRESSIPLP